MRLEQDAIECADKLLQVNCVWTSLKAMHVLPSSKFECMRICAELQLYDLASLQGGTVDMQRECVSFI